MPNIYVMNENKSITNTRQACNYVGEKNADTIMLIVLPFYAGIDIEKCRVSICFDNADIADIPMSLNGVKYKDTYCVFDVNIDTELSKYAGKQRFHFNIVGVNSVIKTGDAYIVFTSKRGGE